MPKVIHTINSNFKYTILYIVGLTSIILLSGIFIPFYISEAKTEAVVGAATQSTISLSLSSNNIALNLLQPGTFDANNLESGVFGSASTTASVSTTNYTGYTLSIAASSSANAGKLIDSTNSDSTKKYFSSIESATSESVFSNSSNTSYNGKWGYKPSYYNSSANSNYLPAPSTTGVTIEQTTAPNTTAKDYTITLGARANINQSAGSYSNTFNIIATANPVTYAITYADNSGDSSVTNLPSAQASNLTTQGKVNTSVITLSSTTPTRTGYTFNKWCLGTVSNSGTTCTGTQYGPGADFGIDQTTNNQNITLYATWSIKTNLSLTINFDTGVSSVAVKSGSATGTTIGTVSTSGGSVSGLTYKTTYYLVPTYASGKKFSAWTQNSVGTGGSGLSSTSAETPSFNIGDGTNSVVLTSKTSKIYMQDVTFTELTELMPNIEDSATLYDKRDGQEYTVAKLKDGKFWMTKNLNLAGGTILTADDTNVTSDYINSFSTSNNLTKVTSPTAGIQLPASSKSGFGSNNYSYVYNSGNAGIIEGNRTTASCGNPGCFSYYSWDAATLGSGRSIGTDNVTAMQSICPRGWKLPSSNSTSPYTSDFFNLATVYGMSTSSSAQSNANFYNQAGPGTIANFFLAGYYNDYNGFLSGDSYGFYWSSASVNNMSDARRLFFSSSNIDSADNNGRYFGFSVRCLFDFTLYTTIASQSKGDFDMSTISAPLTADNSGVYRYKGEHSDNNPNRTKGANDIYFYRGIIDDSFASTYGSSGNGTLYPNYVKLATNGNTTCWRIFRTTASGGVKMLYNGTWTGSTCANSGTSIQLGNTTYYNRYTGYDASSSCSFSNDFCDTIGRAGMVGYNYNGSYLTQSDGTANSRVFTNGTASNARTQIENWYNSAIGSNNNYLFETNAGYCNDRTTYTTDSASALAVTSVVPYATSSAYIGFGARQRLEYNKTPTLSCSNTTGYDLLDGTTGKSYPVALITADEVTLAGNGISMNEAYAYTSYLTSGSSFWTLSPYFRQLAGRLLVFYVYSGGDLSASNASYAYGLRPAVSLAPGTSITGGSGTAADPWTVQ
ncbi:hypothetical protein IJ135_02875 [Candidatus Saccharibacteria bacterium]|nr:hypothetical protein [Candidatus Saccharibacteria bacterium]